MTLSERIWGRHIPHKEMSKAQHLHYIKMWKMLNEDHCKKQATEYMRERRKDPEFREKQRKQNRERWAKDREYWVNYKREYRKKNLEKLRQQDREWRAKNKDKMKESARKYRSKPESKAKKRAYRSLPENRAKDRAYRKKHYRDNIELHRSRAHKRRVLKDEASQKGVPDLAHTETPCIACGKPSEHLDHIVPISKGGDNSLKNLWGLCKFCNLSKGSRSWEEWISKRLVQLDPDRD